MRQQASTNTEILLREINETEEALAEASMVLGCTCIIDPIETLGDRVRHLAMMAILMQANLGQLRKFQGLVASRQDADPYPISYQELLNRLNIPGEN